MNKRICIKIKGLHNVNSPEDEDIVEVIYPGTYYKRNGKHYIKYEEPVENSTAINDNMIKISKDEVEIINKGQSAYQLVFTAGHKNTTFYSTPFGGINMAVDTYALDVQEDENKIVVDIQYGLEINLDYISKCRVGIEILSVEDK